MSTFIKFMAKPRLNNIDFGTISISVGLVMAGHYWSALIAIAVGSVLSVRAEAHAERSSKP